MKKFKTKRPDLPWPEFDRRADEFLVKIQQEHMPQDADKFVAINMETGEYVLADSSGQASDKFLSRWPDVLLFLCRVDGGPAIRFHGK